MIVQNQSTTPMQTPWRAQAEAFTWERSWDLALASAPRALVAEDDPEMRALICAVVRRDGYVVLEAKNGAEFARLVRSEVIRPRLGLPVDIIITDMVMPARSGLDVVAWLRLHDFITPVVLVTAFGSDEVHEEARRLGAAVLDKPFELDELRRVVRNLEHR
ncbi:MAG TPA: response regulator [Anaeromyxobacter sp.]|nr:response regulator [Anaeromyxobacter sp.]